MPSDSDDGEIDREYAVRRLRCYEFAHVVPWTKLVEDMEEQR